jgi:seryl-tRNA(Sec) selenium transferase
MTAPKYPEPSPTTEVRKLPRTDRLLEAAVREGLVARIGHGPVVDGIRAVLEDHRRRILAGAPCPPPAAIEADVLARLAEGARGSLRPVVNATGVVVHTNLGRAPLSAGTIEAMRRAAEGYTNVEYDLDAGERGDRYGHAEAPLCRLTGAEAAVVVNNNASAVMLALAALMEGPPPAGAPAPVREASLASEAPPEVPPLPRAAGEPGVPPLPRAAGEPGVPPLPRAAGEPDVRPLRRAAGEPGVALPCAAGELDVPPLPRAAGERVGVRGPGAGTPEVIVSRGQLVEIGGGFRIPDVLRRSGAALVEVGTTNRTYLRDYEAALTGLTRILLTVHRSNFKLSGFVNDTPLEELVELARRQGLWGVDDLGSGTLLTTAPFGLGDEPTVQERIRAGADVVCFSGDKLLGGPQAGILAGRAEAIRRVKRHPLMRALRVDKVTLAGLSATLAHYERDEATREVPVWRAISASPAALAARARRWREALAGVTDGCEVLESRSAVGGGSLPEVTLPTYVLALPAGNPDALAARLRRGDPPVVGRIEGDRVVLDPRTVMPGEDEALLTAVRAALAS